MGKWLLIGCMLLGRLVVFPVIILLVPEFWRK
jgi:trk system potassium uptake protein TrkH